MRLSTVREIGLLVRTERKRQGLSMQAVADRVGCSRQWIASLEAGGSAWRSRSCCARWLR